MPEIIVAPEEIAPWDTIPDDPMLAKLNKIAGYDLVAELAQKSPGRIAWEAEYLAKREAHVAKYFNHPTLTERIT